MYKEHTLELRVPPVAVFFIVAAGMTSINYGANAVMQFSLLRLCVSLFFAALGIFFTAIGVMTFQRAATTVNPLRPQTSSQLVTNGIYRFTRNPQYLGMLLVLFAWSILLGNLLTLIGPIAFVWYISRFQIIPEERLLKAKFENSFSNYQKTVRRWI